VLRYVGVKDFSSYGLRLSARFSYEFCYVFLTVVSLILDSSCALEEE